MILDIPVEIGNSVIESNTFNDGTTVAIVADMGEMVFEGKLDESEVGKIRQGVRQCDTLVPLTMLVSMLNWSTFHQKRLKNGAISLNKAGYIRTS
ncbi:MAG: hypothetical protein R2764_05440 [Bacteroidales bacterium]